MFYLCFLTFLRKTHVQQVLFPNTAAQVPRFQIPFNCSHILGPYLSVILTANTYQSHTLCVGQIVKLDVFFTVYNTSVL